MPVQALFSAFLMVNTVLENRKMSCIILERCLSKMQLKN